jgi:quercetin dioxygenase-like cupin family protein
MSEPGRSAFMVKPGETAEVPVAGGRSYLLLAAVEQTGSYRLIENEVGAGVEAHPVHRHPESEAYYVLDGSFEVFVEGTTYVADAGTFVFIPADADHTFRAGPNGGRKLTIVTPMATGENETTPA